MEKEKIIAEIPMEVDKNIELRNKKANSRVLIKVAILNIVNLILIITIFFLVGKLPALGETLKEMRSASFAREGENDIVILRSEVERNQEKIDKLDSLIVDDTGLVNFVESINNMRNEGLITEFTLTGAAPITNSRREFGYPISFVFQGSREQINSGLQRLYELPVLFNITNAELEGTSEEAIYRLNIFLLVKD